jgi:hypothetical protein
MPKKLAKDLAMAMAKDLFKVATTAMDPTLPVGTPAAIVVPPQSVTR